jgi:hypothetical protein
MSEKTFAQPIRGTDQIGDKNFFDFLPSFGIIDIIFTIIRFTHTMSSVKKRKLDAELPSGLLTKEKSEKKDSSKTTAAPPVSQSPEPKPQPTQSTSPEQEEETGATEEVVKNFKDLVNCIILQSAESVAD